MAILYKYEKRNKQKHFMSFYYINVMILKRIKNYKFTLPFLIQFDLLRKRWSAPYTAHCTHLSSIFKVHSSRAPIKCLFDYFLWHHTWLCAVAFYGRCGRVCVSTTPHAIYGSKAYTQLMAILKLHLIYLSEPFDRRIAHF